MKCTKISLRPFYHLRLVTSYTSIIANFLLLVNTFYFLFIKFYCGISFFTCYPYIIAFIFPAVKSFLLHFEKVLFSFSYIYYSIYFSFCQALLCLAFNTFLVYFSIMGANSHKCSKSAHSAIFIFYPTHPTRIK